MLTAGNTYTTQQIINGSTASAQAIAQLTTIQAQWERTLANSAEDIAKQPFISDARKVTIATGAGNTVSLKGMTRIPTATKPLDEGVTPNGQGYSVDSFSISVAEYGSWIAFTNQTDVVTSFGNITAKAMVELRRSAVESKAKIVRDTLIAQASEYFAGSKADKDALVAGDLPKIVDMFAIRRTIANAYGNLFGNKVKVVLSYDAADALLLYDPIVAAFMDFGSTNALLQDGEVSDMMGLMFVKLTYGKESDVTVTERSTDGTKIEPILIYAKDSFVIAEQKGGMAIQMIFKPLGSSGTADPLNQRGTFGWYMGNFGVKVRVPKWIYAYWVAIEADPNAPIFAENVNVVNTVATTVTP